MIKKQWQVLTLLSSEVLPGQWQQWQWQEEKVIVQATRETRRHADSGRGARGGGERHRGTTFLETGTAALPGLAAAAVSARDSGRRRTNGSERGRRSEKGDYSVFQTAATVTVYYSTSWSRIDRETDGRSLFYLVTKIDYLSRTRTTTTTKTTKERKICSLILFNTIV